MLVTAPRSSLVRINTIGHVEDRKGDPNSGHVVVKEATLRGCDEGCSDENVEFVGIAA